MKNTINKKHILGIDALRFIAAFMVMLFHFGFLLGNLPDDGIRAIGQHLVAFPELSDFTYFGWVGVEIFFVISGFVIAFSGERSSAFNFFVSRVVRLGPGVWICAPITLLALFAVGFPVGENELRGLRHSMAFLPWAPWIDGAYWTLGIEIVFYAFVFGLIALKRFMAVRYLAIAIGVVSTMYWLPGSPLAAVLNLLPERVQQLLLIRHGMFFALGVFLWLHLVKREGRNLEWCVLFCVGGCLQIAHQTVEWNIGCNKHYSPLVGCAIWLLSVGAIVASVRFNHLVHRAPQWFLRLMKSAGLMTFPLYLLHEVVGIAAMGALVKHGMNRWPALVVVCAGAILLAWLIATHVEPLAQRLTKSLLLRGHAQWTRIGERLSKLPAGKSS